MSSDGRIDMMTGPAGRLAVRRYGVDRKDATPILLIHPVNTGGGIWHRVAAALAVVRPVIVPDLRGHGASDKDGPFDAAAYAADVVAVLDHCAAGRAHIAGGSIGGPVGVLLAADNPDRIASIASFGGALTLHLPEDALPALAVMAAEGDGDALLRHLLPSAFGSASRTPALIEKALAVAGGRDAGLILALIRGAFSTDVREAAGRVRAAALVVNGSEDMTCPPAAGEAMAAATRGRAIRLDGVGHLPMLEVPELVAVLLADHNAAAERRGHG